MRRIILLILLSVPFFGFAQVEDPVKWSFAAKKLNAGTYETRLVATIAPGWHIYSQTTPEGGPVPTTVSFTKNPLVTLDGELKELGRLEQKHERIFDLDVKQFSGKVDFVQVVKIKGNAKTIVAGEIESMVCNDTKCLPPKTVKFSVTLN